jgi:hypothetical protein
MAKRVLNDTKVIIYYGLPGSGKSTRLDQLKAHGIQVFDDFMKYLMNNSRAFTSSRHYADIVNAANSKVTCSLADIRLCLQEFRQEIIQDLNQHAPTTLLEWHCFDCRSQQAINTCIDNVLFRTERTGRNGDHALRWIEKNASRFTIMEGATIHPVVHARSICKDSVASKPPNSTSP